MLGLRRSPSHPVTNKDIEHFVESGENVVKPDAEITTSWADFKAGRDPVLEGALRQ